MRCFQQRKIIFTKKVLTFTKIVFIFFFVADNADYDKQGYSKMNINFTDEQLITIKLALISKQYYLLHLIRQGGVTPYFSLELRSDLDDVNTCIDILHNHGV